jgi:hypothetical protein
MVNQPIFAIGNHHTEGCGKPPIVDDTGPDCYRGYFENEHGEQAIFVYDRTTREGTLVKSNFVEPRQRRNSLRGCPQERMNL